LLVHVDACFLTVALGDTDTHRRSEAGGGGVLEQTPGDDGVADQVNLDSMGIPASLIVGPCSISQKMEKLLGAETSST